MTKFRVHGVWNGENFTHVRNAGSADEAANVARKIYPGAIVTKVKVDRSNSDYKYTPVMDARSRH